MWQEEKVSEVERELNDAQQRVEGAKAAYELIVRRMNAELPRFQRERAQVLPPQNWPLCNPGLSIPI